MLPEKWTALGTGDDLRGGAEPLDAPAIAWAAAIARELGIDLVAGSIAERVAGRRQAAQHLRARRARRRDARRYRKIHLFDVEVGRVEYRESDHEDPGDEPVLTARPTASRSG